MTPSCRPHRWSWPEVGDTRLTCARCGRVLHFDELRSYQIKGIIRAGRRLHGLEKSLRRSPRRSSPL